MRRAERTRVALFATHPIQYHAQWFRQLAARPEITLTVYFGFEPDATQQGTGFGADFDWDIALRDGYTSEVLDNVARRPAVGTFSGCDTPAIGARLAAGRPDVAIVTGWQSKMLVQAWWSAARLRVPRLLRGESNAMRWRSAWKRAGHRWWLRGFDAFLAIGKSNREFYREAGVPSRRIHDCPYFVDNARFDAAARALRGQRAQLRRDFAIPEGAACFLYCGKLIAKKRPLDLLAALERARQKNPRLHVLMVGTGELGEAAQAMAATQKLPVTFAGFLNQSEIVRAYVASDCLVLPSDTGETWGIVVNEAMACGLPAIVSDEVGCGPDLVEEGVSGATFPMGDVDALARRILDFAARPQRLPAMGARARERVFSGYSVERAVAGTLAAIDAVVPRT